MNHRIRTFAGLGIAALAISGLIGYQIWSGYQEVTQTAQNKTRDYASILATRLDATLRRVRADLNDIKNTIPAATLDARAQSRYTSQVVSRLTDHKLDFPEVADFAITDAGGTVIYTTSTRAGSRLSDRAYFQLARDNPQARLVFSEVLVSRTTGRPILSINQALRDERDAFRGLVFATLDLPYFEKLFQDMNTGTQGIVGIYRSDDFSRVVRWPRAREASNPRAPANHPLRAAFARGEKMVTLSTRGNADGTERIYSYHALEGFPFYVAVGVATDGELAAWKTRSLAIGFSGLLAMALMLALIIRLLRSEEKQSLSLRKLMKTEERYRHLVEDSPDGVLVHRDGKIVYVNPVALKMLQAAQASDLLGKPVMNLIHPDSAALVRARIAAVEKRNETTPLQEIRFVGINGNVIDAETRGAPVEFDGEPAIQVIWKDISERRRAESARMHLAAIVDGSNDAIISRALDGTILTWNAAAEKIFGYTVEESIGKPIYALIAQGVSDIREDNNRRLLAGEVFSSETELKTRDGRSVPIHSDYSPIRDAAGNMVTVSIIFQDISERKRIEAALLAREQSYVSLVSNVSGAVYRCLNDPDWTIEFISEGCFQVTGYRDDELLGNKVTSLGAIMHPDDAQPVWEKCQASLEARTRCSNEYRIIHRSGEVRWVWDQAQGTYAKDGTLISIDGLLTDITARKQADAAQVLLAAIVENSNDAIYSRNDDGTIMSWNAGAVKMLGYSAAEAIGQSAHFAVPPIWPDRWKQTQERLHRGEVVVHESARKTKDGRVIPVLSSHSPVRDSAGKVIGSSCILQDLTERKRAEARHAELEAQLHESQKMQAIGTLAGGIAHDFNNALATILGNLELARQDSANNPAALESLEEIRKAGTRARNLVQQILAFSRRQPSERTALDLAPVVEESARLLRATVPARLSVEVRCAAELPLVLGNVTQLEQVIINLGTNAMQAMREGPGRIGIAIDIVVLDATLAEAHPALQSLFERHPGRTLRLAVTDTGPGMDAATRERIFEPFFTTKPVNEGTGLGLSVVHGIVQGHEGVITVESAPGQGATFAIYLPLAPAEPASPPDTGAAAATPALTLDGGQRILYVDDDASLLSLVKRLLERRGYRVSTYSEPRAALAALRAEPAAFDLLLTDYNMPGMSGLDVAREARIIRADLPVAVASGFIDETLREQAAEAGVRELLFKADEVETFCVAVQQLLAG